MSSQFDTSRSIVQALNHDLYARYDVKVFVKRDDLIDEYISGNKWRKLKYNLDLCRTKKNKQIITFGGAFSNHIVATAKACHLEGIKSIGIIRGEELNKDSNETLKKCSDFGMELHFVSRDEYRMRNEKAYLEELHQQFENSFIIPEGGANYYGVIGCQEILRECDEEVDVVVCAGGTGTTAAGILLSLRENQRLLYVSALKGSFIEEDLRKLLYLACFDFEIVEELMNRVQVIDDKRFGGYHKYDDDLIHFVQDYFKKTNLKLDVIYTAKAMLELHGQIITDKIKKDSRILFIHTGGLQAMPSIEKKLGYPLYK